MFSSFLNLKEDIGSDRPVDEDDTFKAKHAFKSIGYYDEPSYGMTPYPDQPLFDGIKKFQKDKGLYQDALMEPEGETVTALRKRSSESPVKPAYAPVTNEGHIGKLEAKKDGHVNQINDLRKRRSNERDQDERGRITEAIKILKKKVRQIDREIEFYRRLDGQ